MVDKTELIVGVNTDEVKEGTKNLKDFGTTGEKTESKVARLEKATEKLNDDFKRQAKAAGLSANEVKLLALKDAGATKEQLALARSSMEVADKAKKQAPSEPCAALCNKFLGSYKMLRFKPKWEQVPLLLLVNRGRKWLLSLGLEVLYLVL